MRGKPKSEAESETSPGVLLASGYIAGGTLCGLLVAFFAFNDDFKEWINLGLHIFGTNKEWDPDSHIGAEIASLVMYGLLAMILLWVGSRKDRPGNQT